MSLGLRSFRALKTPQTTAAWRRFASHEAPKYNEPSGWLFGEKPPAPGTKRVKEGWENIWLIGMFGTMAFTAVGLYYKPDDDLQSWAMREAKARMEARGEVYKYKPSDESVQVAP